MVSVKVEYGLEFFVIVGLRLIVNYSFFFRCLVYINRV
jgi:hypothetical protein